MEPQLIQNKIYQIRGLNVMLDFHLAMLYNVETRSLKQAVKRNLKRFPFDFMIELTELEMEDMVSQNVIPSKSYFGGSKPMAFTEQGIAMLSSVLKSDKAIEVNISIMRAFVLVRQHLTNHKELIIKIAELEKEMKMKFKDVYEALNYLLDKDKIEIEQIKRKKIGFK
ncbi:MAG: ORF6N domain-containing protein [Bacteroidota bacterium]|nr:ORF6N domain-containing protein [Bacteroidota bacterium]